MAQMLTKNTLRDVKKTKARFISIMLIIMLGVGFLVGINSTAPSMFQVVEQYYDSQNLMDYRLLSTVGFTDDDVKAIQEVEGVRDVMPSYFSDLLITGDTGSVVRLYSVPEKYGDNNIINELTLRKGRMPKAANEILVGTNKYNEETLGTVVSFAAPDEGVDLSSVLKYTEFTVVGIVDSPLYISFERGSTNVGSGKIADYMFVTSDCFTMERYAEIYVTADELRGVDPYSDEYKNLRDEFAKKLEHVGGLCIEDFTQEIAEPAQASYDEANAQYIAKKADAEKEIASAQASIDEARETFGQEVATAQDELTYAREQLTEAAEELEAQKAEFEERIALAQQEIVSAKAQIQAAKSELESAKYQLKESLYEKCAELGISRVQFDSFYGNKDLPTSEDIQKISLFITVYRPAVSGELASLENSIKAMEEQFALTGADPAQNAEYIAAKTEYEKYSIMLAAMDEFESSGKQELENTIKTLEGAQTEITASEDKIKQSEETLASEISTALAQFSEAEAELLLAEEEYNRAVEELASTSEQVSGELDAAQAELDSRKAQAEEEFANAEQELAKAKSELDKVSDPQWYYNNRDHNPGYSSYEDNVGSLIAVGKVFPVFFLLVAVLVCVTTMSRLVEEQRGDIGALTTLGYKKRQIIGKYVGYSVSATVVGAVVGIFAGLMVLPAVIFNAYRMLYSSLPELTLKLDVTSAIVATAVAILCTSSVAYFTCNALLRKEPATLLRPKAPKPGKRILLERIDFIWKRFGFFSKVTVRNIFRYKARFLMTVIGVAGCTALIVAAMGLQRSINDVVQLQFGEIFTNDSVIALEGSEQDRAELKEKIEADSRFEKVALCRQNLISAMTGYGCFEDDTYIVVPEDISAYTEIVNLRDRKSGEKIEFSDNGVILSEKLAKKLNVSTGDEVRVIDKDIKKPFIVDGICENYMYGYVFMSADVYRANFEIEPEYNMYMCKNAENMGCSDEELAAEYIDTKGVLGVSFVDSSIVSFEDMISSLNYVVLVMVVCAAALAFVVLYNLTNINVAERKREISTLKVLGFKDSETSAYIYRENILLTVVGIAVGLVLGVLLLNFVITTVEIDMVMFGRQLYASTFIIAAVLTAVFAAVVNFVMHFRIKKIDMIESLKSIE